MKYHEEPLAERIFVLLHLQPVHKIKEKEITFAQTAPNAAIVYNCPTVSGIPITPTDAQRTQEYKH